MGKVVNGLKKKLFLKLILRARSFCLIYRKYAKQVTYSVLALIVILSLIFYPFEKICEIPGYFVKSFKNNKKRLIEPAFLICAVALMINFSSVTTMGSVVVHDKVFSQENSETIENLEADVTETEKIAKNAEVEVNEAESETLEEKTVADSEDSESTVDSEKLLDAELSEEEETAITHAEWDTSGVELKALIEQYPETVAWIYFEDGSINYPIMQTEDNEKYMNHDIDGNEANAGAIFLDYRSSADFSDSNSIVFGHNMKDRTMFGTLRKYGQDPGFYKDHQYFQVITPRGKYRYQIFAYMDVKDDFPLYDFVGDNSKAFVEDPEPIRLKSYLDSELEIDENSKVVTLSTCTTKDDLRFVVLGVRVDESK